MKIQGILTNRNKHLKQYIPFYSVNHFPLSYHFGRKDHLWRSIVFMQRIHGFEEFNFMPRTFPIPKERELLRREWLAEGEPHYWIIKPPAKARGIGIQLATEWTQIEEAKNVLVQKYIANPFLINHSKFDLRIYVFLYSVYPLIVYVHKEGLVRFASHQYKTSPCHADDQFMHLTNYSINRKNTDYRRNSNTEKAAGHKWTLSVLWKHLNENGIDWTPIWENMKDIIVKTCISVEHHLKKAVKGICKSPYNVQELLGFDIILDGNLKPWLLEVNISPSMNIDSELDFKVKDKVIVDMLNITGIHLPPEGEVSESTFDLPCNRYSQPSGSSIMRTDRSPDVEFTFYDDFTETELCTPPQDNRRPPAPKHPWHFDRRLFLSKLGPDELSKQGLYEDQARRRKVQKYKAPYTMPQSCQILPSTSNFAGSNLSEECTCSSSTVSQGTDPECFSFETYLRIAEERKRFAQLKKEARNSCCDIPWLRNRRSDAIEQQTTDKLLSTKAAPPARGMQYWSDSNFYRTATQNILDRLTPADIRCLIRLLDSINRAGDFRLVFPAPTTLQTARYLNYFKNPGYYNLLNFAYLNKYRSNSQMGIDLLKRLCQREVHLKSTFYGDELDEDNIWPQ